MYYNNRYYCCYNTRIWYTELLVTFIGLKVKTLSSTWRGRARLRYLRRPQNVITPPTVWHFKWIHPVNRGFFFLRVHTVCRNVGGPPLLYGTDIPLSAYLSLRACARDSSRFATKQKRITYNKKIKNKCIMLFLDVDNRSGFV